jgi:predicted enzyme related to lactoylglutathione lyase
MNNQVVWFDIPSKNLERAIRFYSQVLAITIKQEEFPGWRMGVFPHTDGQVSGCIVEEKDHQPSNHGLLLYFNANGRLDEAVVQVEKQEGKVIEPKHAIGEWGFRAIVLDSEGNRIALHSES